ncbi:MAG: hypothetical protein C4538_00475 [Nitrospiraceae bacterium]|nr:MAG: hypothetical protein C4538_00475 [Nitrospiraceae bacterium]
MRKYKTILLLTALLLCISDSMSAIATDNDSSIQQTKGQDKPFSVFTAFSMKVLSEYYTNSSDFTRKSAGAEFGFSAAEGLHLETGYVLSDFSQDGFEDILRHSVFIQGENRLSGSITLLARLSGNLYDNDNTNLNGGLFVRYQPLANVFTEFSFRHFDIIDTVLPFNNVIYSHVVTIGSVVRDIQTDDYKLYLLYYPAPKVSFAGEVVYGDYSDGNEKRSLMLEAGYQVLDNPYLRAAYNYFYLDIKDPAPVARSKDTVESAYWDPINFETHTLRLEYRQAFNKHLSLGAEAALSYSPKSSGLSKSAFLSASYAFTERSSLRFDARWFDQNEGVERLEEGDRFWATNYTIAFQHRF